MAKKPYIIALEEHYQDPEVRKLGAGPGAGRDIVERLDDLGALRIREMDEAGIDLQVLSHSIPGLQAVDAEAGPPLARRTNDRLSEAVQRHPGRFSAFAVLPTANPRAAADELERAVTQLGFKGAMVNGMTNGAGGASAADAALSTSVPSGSTTTVQARVRYLKVSRMRPASSSTPVSATL